MNAISKKQLQDQFDDIWQRFSKEIKTKTKRTGTHAKSARRVSLDSTHTLTLVVRLSSQLYPNIERVISGIRRAYPEHYYYPVQDTHFTILNCMPFLRGGNYLVASDIHRIGTKLEAVFQQYRSFAVDLEGLNLFPTTVFIQLFDLTGTIKALRSDITQALSSEFVDSAVKANILVPDPLVSYSNIVRFQGQVSPGFVELISTRRKIKLGHVRVKYIELVTTDKLLSNRNTQVWAKFELREK